MTESGRVGLPVVLTDAEELWAWVAEVQRRGLRLYVTGKNGALHEFRVPAALFDGQTNLEYDAARTACDHAACGEDRCDAG